MSKKLKIIFFGTPDFAVASLDAIIKAGFDILAVVTAPDKKAGRGMKTSMSAVKKYALEHNLRLFQPKNLKNKDFQDALRQLKADIQVVIAFRMMPEAVWNMPPQGTINLHGSFLPYYRGAAPINWAVINQEEFSGVTTFKLKHEIDTGDLLLRLKVPLDIGETAGTLHNKLMLKGADLMVETLEGLELGVIETTEQNWDDSYPVAPKIFKEDCVISFDKTGNEILGLINGLNPYPTARCEIEGRTWLVYTAAFLPHKTSPEVGQVFYNKKRIFVSCTDGWIELLEVKPQGKRRMKVSEILNGWKGAKAILLDHDLNPIVL